MAREGLRSRKDDAKDGEDTGPTDLGGDSAAKAVAMEAVRALAAKGRLAMVVGETAYDFTDFANLHPGGPEYLQKNAGKVATEEFVASHPEDIIERTLSDEQFKVMTKGPIDKATIKDSDVAKHAGGGDHDKAIVADGNKPGLNGCINIYDFEAIASRVCPEQGWVYYSSGSDDEITLRENHNAFHRIWFRPRVMVNVKEIDMTQTILGHKCSMPMMLSAVAMCKLGHPEGETAWMKGASAEDIIYMVPTLSGCSYKDICASRPADYPMFYQLYVNQDKNKTKKLVQTAEKAGASALFITCDAPQLGNRERDRRVKVTHAGAAEQSGGKKVTQDQGTSKALTTFIDPSLNWDDLEWFKSIAGSMKIVLKGVGTAEDAVQAMEYGCAGVMLSNHGGRQLDFARSAIEVLPEVMAALRAHKDYDPAKFEVFIDGGIRRGTDIFKALALGAKAVGVGRPALYAMTAFGAEGVQKMIQIFKQELTMCMQLMGTPSLDKISPKSVITTDLGRHYAMTPPDMLQRETYIPPVTQARMNGFERAGTKKASDKDKAEAPAAVAASGSSALPVLIGEVLKSTMYSIFSLDTRVALHRTAIFMIVFLVIHVTGNLAFFLGQDAFNQWAAFLTTGTVGTIVLGVEYYLAAAAVIHIAAASYLTLKFNKLALPKKGPIYMWPLGQAKLALTGLAITAFILLHLTHFKFGEVPLLDNGTRDLYSKQLEVFKDVNTCVLYAGAILMMGVHVHAGWPKTVLKFAGTDQVKKHKAEIVAIGQAAIMAVSAAYLACIAGAYAEANKA